MAPLKDAVGPSQEALLALEKSTASTDAQLDHAARILRLDWSQATGLLDSTDTFDRKTYGPAPKEQWVLRWLLKRLKTKPYRTHPRSFLLLQILVRRIPRKSVAVILGDYKFPQLLKDIVEDLDNAVVQSLQDLAPSDSETSTTLDRSPVRSKKRKRDGDAADQTQPELAVVVAAHIGFLDSLYTLTGLAKGRDHDGDGDISQIHLKQSLRMEPMAIAPILGKLLRLSARLVVKFSKEKNKSELQHLLKVTAATFTLWDFKKQTAGAGGKSEFDAAFSNYCFLEALRLYRLVLCVGGTSASADFIVHSVERLIVLHVVIPARTAFISRGGSGIDYSKDDDPDWSAVQPVTATFKPLLEDKCGQDIDCTGIERSPRSEGDACIFAPTWRAAELVPTFYNIIARSVPRNSFRRHAGEASWLETTFVALAELAYSMTKRVIGDTSGFIPLLEQLFIVVRTRNIKLSLHTFLTHAAYTGLLKGKENPQGVHWPLTALFVELGVDIFLPNSGFKDSQRLLSALLLTLSQIRGRQIQDNTYRLVRRGVVIPLLRAFAAARDLPSFIQQWQGQLRDVESLRGPGTQYEDAYSVWEDDQVATAFRQVMKTSLNESQLRSMIQGAIDGVTSNTEAFASSPESYASIVLLEISSELWGNHGIPGLQIEPVTGLVKAALGTLLLHNNIHWKWRLWRLARNLLPITLKSPRNGPNDLAQKLERIALTVTQNIQPENATSDDLRESLEACQFLLQTTQDLEHGACEGEAIVQTLFDNINKLLQGLLSLENKHIPPWNGRIEDIKFSFQLAAAYIVCLMKSHNIWRRVPAEPLRKFVDCFMLLAWRTRSPLEPENPSRGVHIYQLWEVFISNDYLLDLAPLCSAVGRVLFEHLKSDSEQRLFALQFLPRIPVRLHSIEGAKEAMEHLLKGDSCSPQSIPDTLVLILKWCRESTAVVTAAREWISSTLPLQASDDGILALQSFRALCQTVFGQELGESTANLPKLLKRYYKIASRGGSTMESKHSQDEQLSLTPVLSAILLRQIWERRDDAQDAKLVKDVIRQRQKLLQFVVDSLDTSKHTLRDKGKLDARGRVSQAITLYMFDELRDLAQGNRKVEKRVTEVCNILATSIEPDDCLHAVVRQQQLVEFAHEDGLVLDDARLAQAANLERLYAEEQEQFIRDTTSKLEAMSNVGRLQTIRQIQDYGFDGATGTCRLLIAGLAVSTLDEIPERGSEEARAVSSLCTAIIDVVQDSQTIEQFAFASECLDVILRLHPRGVSQYNIDQCLSAVPKTISNISSRESLQEVSAEFASTIYTRLCRLLGTLFGLYRQQLGGRFHLVVPALQSLLRALFAPSRKRKRTPGPFSITASSSSSSSSPSAMHRALGVPHAVMFSRLLSSLCDPTMSAVSRHTTGGGQHDGLIDQTKKAKLIAGQHLRILIESYTSNMLDGPISAAIKTALAPGLYAVLDAMSTDTKRALNASLDASSRAIFRTLHEEYVKFGKWNSKG